MTLRKKSEIEQRRVKVVTSIIVERNNTNRCHYTCPYVEDFWGYPECRLYNSPLGKVEGKQIVYRCKKCMKADRLNERLISKLKTIYNLLINEKYELAKEKVRRLLERMKSGLSF